MAPALAISRRTFPDRRADLYSKPHPLIRPTSPIIRDLIYHVEARRLVDPIQGLVYSRLGKVAGRVYGDGYVRLSWKHDSSWQYAHRIIWSAVNGPIPPGLYIDHLNGRKADNRIINLDAVTPSQNAQRAILFGAAPVGEQRSDAKLTDDLVRDIRASIGKVSTREWARRLCVDPATVRAVRHNRSWRHVPPEGARGHLRRRPGAGR